LSIVENQVKYLRSLGIEAAYTGERKTRDQEILDGKWELPVLSGSPDH